MADSDDKVLKLFGNDMLAHFMLKLYTRCPFIVFAAFWSLVSVGVFQVFTHCALTLEQAAARLVFIIVGTPLGYRWFQSIIAAYQEQKAAEIPGLSVEKNMRHPALYLLTFLMVATIAYFQYFAAPSHPDCFYPYLLLGLPWDFIWWWFILRCFLMICLVLWDWRGMCLRVTTIENLNIFSCHDAFGFQQMLRSIEWLMVVYAAVIGSYLCYYTLFDAGTAGLGDKVFILWLPYVAFPFYIVFTLTTGMKKAFAHRQNAHLAELSLKMDKCLKHQDEIGFEKYRQLYQAVASVRFPLSLPISLSSIYQLIMFLLSLLSKLQIFKHFF